MNGPEDQALLLGSLVGLSVGTVAVIGLVVWWFRSGTATHSN